MAVKTTPTDRPDPAPAAARGLAIRVIVKALVLFAALNVGYALLDPLPALGGLSIYNTLVPGRERLPFGENPEQAYNLSLFQLDAMFASHEVAGHADPGVYRVFVIGDSSVWGILLKPDDTIAGQINRAHLRAPDGRPVHAYNLGYPTLSVTKDLLVLSRAMRYRPDLIVWLITLESLPRNKQMSSPIVQHNADEIRTLIARAHLSLDPHDPQLVDRTFWDRTIIGERRDLADVIRLNLYGVMWAATGIDQYYPESYTPLQRDFAADDSFYNLRPPLKPGDVSLETLDAGIAITGNVPVLIVNEPIFVSSGANSNIRYNFYYPRWAYDDYRHLMAEQAQRRGWWYLDLWDIVSPEQFTNSAIHMTPAGVATLGQRVGQAISQGHGPIVPLR